MPRIIDISVPLAPDIPVWADDPAFSLKMIAGFESGDAVRVSALSMSLHTGTHIDAPAHFIKNGLTISDLPPERFFGRCQVIGVSSPGKNTPEPLPEITQRRVLFKTVNSEKMRTRKPVEKDFIGLREETVNRLLQNKVDLIGVDYYSIEPDGDYPLHRNLLEHSVLLLEGLDLTDAEPGEYTLACFPLRITGAEASPVRAVLICDD